MKTLVIDGDLLVYQAAFAAQASDEIMPLYMAQRIIKNMIEGHIKYIKRRFGENLKVILYLTSDDKSNYRFAVATSHPYKGNRKLEKPIYYKALRTYLVKNYQGKIVDGREADDAISIYACLDPDETIIMSADKDLRMIRGKKGSWHWEMDYNEAPYFVDSDSLGVLLLKKSNSGHTKAWGTGLKWFYYQLIVGDKTCDNIHGLKREGPVGTVKYLSDCYTEKMLFIYVLTLYILHKVPYDRLIENGRLLWLQTHEKDLWEPPFTPSQSQMEKLQALVGKTSRNLLKPLLIKNLQNLNQLFGQL